MRYLPKSPAERQEMLAAIGAKSIDELFSSIPEQYRAEKGPEICPGRFPKRKSSVFQGARRGKFPRLHQFSWRRRLQPSCARW